MRPSWRALLVFSIMTALQSIALADDANTTADHSLPGILYNNDIITKQQYDRIRARTQAERRESKTMQLGGYMQLDVPLAVSPANVLGSSTVLRRLYLAAYGKLGTDWKYRAQFGFERGEAALSTAVVSYLGVRRATITFGYMKEPFSLGYMTAPRQRAFTERALPTAFVPGKRIGLMVDGHGKRWTLSGGIFGNRYDDTASGDPAGNARQARFGESLRGTLAPIMAHDFLWEVGASAATRAADSTHIYSFDSGPEEAVVGAKLVNTGKIEDVSSVQKYGAETGIFAGPLSVQGEYLVAEVRRSDRLPNLSFNGWYLQTTWMLTGGRRRFLPSVGKVFAPASYPGAVELALRYSTLDLNDDDVSGGYERDASAGINWYVMRDVLLMADYTHVQPVIRGTYDGVSSNIVEARIQVVF